jgi:hypothetical protein
MSWVEAYGLAGIDVSIPGVQDFTRGAIVQWGVGQGLSGNAILQTMSDVGVGLQRTQGLALVSAERERRGASLTSAQLNVDYSTGSILDATPPFNWTGEYVHQVTVTYREKVADNTFELHTRTVGIKAGAPLTPFAAIEGAMNYLSALPDDPESPNLPERSQVILSQLTGVWYDTQGRNLPRALGLVG